MIYEFFSLIFLAIQLIIAFYTIRVIYPLVVAIWYKIVYRDRLHFGYYPIKGYLQNYKDIKDQTNIIIKNSPRCQAIMTNYLHHPLVYFIDVDSSSSVFKNAQLYKKHHESYFYTKFMGNGVLYTSGLKWKEQRQVLAQAFHFSEMSDQIEIIKKAVNEALLKIPTNGQTVQLVDIMKKLTGEVALRSFFGESFNKQTILGQQVSVILNNSIVRLSNRAHELKYLLMGIVYEYGCEKWFINQNDQKSINVLQQYTKMVCEIVSQRVEKFQGLKSQSDILDRCIQDQLNKNPNKQITAAQIEEIVHQFTVIFFAGSITTANLAGKLFFYLASHTDELEKVKEEIDQLFTDPNQITMSDLNKMKYSQAFIYQVLRVSPPVPSLSLREATQTHDVNGIKIYKGMLIGLNINGIMRSEKNFTNADTFKPSRFIEKEEEEIKLQFNPAFIPFSYGPRNCIGNHLGLLEAKIILIYFIRTFNFKLHNRPKKKFIFSKRF